MCRMKELVGMAKPASSPLAAGSNKHADINIFTVASGLLYEVNPLPSSEVGADS